MRCALGIEDRVGVPAGYQGHDDAREELASHKAHGCRLIDPVLELCDAGGCDHVQLAIRTRAALDCRDVDEAVAMQPSKRCVDLSERQRAGTREVFVVSMLQLISMLGAFFQESQEGMPERHRPTIRIMYTLRK